MNHIWVVEFWLDGRWKPSVNVRLTRHAALAMARNFRRMNIARPGETCRYRVKRYEVKQ